MKIVKSTVKGLFTGIYLLSVICSSFFRTGEFIFSSSANASNSNYQVGSQTIELTPVADVLIDPDEGDKNYGKTDFCAVSHNGAACLMKFDFSQIPADAEVISGSLYLAKLADTWSQGSAVQLRAMINNDWKEGTFKGNNAKDGETTYNRLAHNQKSWHG